MSPGIDLANIEPGFADPVLGSQSVFRAVMDAVARPGSVADLSFAPDPPVGLGKAAGAVALTLFDFETPIWLDTALDQGPAQTWLRFHCGCPVVTDPQDAAFAIICAPKLAPPISAFNIGDAKYPDRSTTLVLEIEALSGGEEVTLRGPGIKGTTRVSPLGLPTDFWVQLADNGAQFQFGVDILLVSGDHLLALPRSTRIQIEGA